MLPFGIAKLGQCDVYPADIGRWLGVLLNKIRIWCDRRGFGYHAIWARENYEGYRREHVHLLLYIRLGHRDAFDDALRRWLPGGERVLLAKDPKYETDRYGRRINKAFTYMLKQMTTQASYALGYRVRREKACPETGAPVAAVIGKRCGVSRSLNKCTRETFWATPRPAIRAPRPTPAATGTAG